MSTGKHKDLFHFNVCKEHPNHFFFGQEMATVDTSATKHKRKTERDPPYIGVIPSLGNYKKERR